MSAKKDPIIKAHPSVKQIANFCGINTITGRNMVNAIKTKNTPVARNNPKYMRAFPEGTLLVADWRFPGISLTPLETLNTYQQTSNKDYMQTTKWIHSEINNDTKQK